VPSHFCHASFAKNLRDKMPHMASPLLPTVS